jgi:hypothetical protein
MSENYSGPDNYIICSLRCNKPAMRIINTSATALSMYTTLAGYYSKAIGITNVILNY